MAATVLHFGWDDCYRVRVLQQAGYTVKQEQSLDDLELDLQRSEPVDAVVLSENTSCSVEQAADLVRQRSTAPVILFRRSMRDLDERKFDVIYPWFVPPVEWLARTAEVIAASRALKTQSQRLRHEAAAVRRESESLRARSREERERGKPKPVD